MDFSQSRWVLIPIFLQISPASDVARIAAKVVFDTRQADGNDVGGKFHGAVELQESQVKLGKEVVKPGLVLGVYLPQLDKSADLIVRLWKLH